MNQSICTGDVVHNQSSHMNQASHPAVGIDLGTTFSAVARLDDIGRPDTLINAEGDKTTPSVVLIDGTDVVVGKEAAKAMATDMHAIAETEISDWMFFRDGVAIGNRTLVVLFDQMPEEEVASVKQMLGWQ